MPINELIYFILACSIITIITIIRSNNLLFITILSSSFSLLTVILYLILDAPDVAMTEASVSIISFALIIIAINKVKESGYFIFRKNNLLLIVFCLAFAVYLIKATSFMPEFEAPNFDQYYLLKSKNEIGIPSSVASILASYRGYDTLLETIVIMISMIAVLLISNDPKKSFVLKDVQIKVMSRVIAPLIFIFALYIQSHGEISPGGGFQAGAIIATMFIVYAISYGDSAILSKLSLNQIASIAVLGVTIYLLIGALGFYKGFEFLNYNYLLGQKLSIIIVELGVCITVGASFLAIYLSVNNAKSL